MLPTVTLIPFSKLNQDFLYALEKTENQHSDLPWITNAISFERGSVYRKVFLSHALFRLRVLLLCENPSGRCISRKYQKGQRNPHLEILLVDEFGHRSRIFLHTFWERGIGRKRFEWMNTPRVDPYIDCETTSHAAESRSIKLGRQPRTACKEEEDIYQKNVCSCNFKSLFRGKYVLVRPWVTLTIFVITIPFRRMCYSYFSKNYFPRWMQAY